jgi:acyl-coenzyme A synthetase/AMP-(fatty) acid ligase
LKNIDRFLTCFQENQSNVLFRTKNKINFSYESFWKNALCLAKKWSDNGLKKGNIVVLNIDNDISIPCAILACAIGGFVACPIVDKKMLPRIITELNPSLIINKKIDLDDNIHMEEVDSYDILHKKSDYFLINFTAGSSGEPKIMCHGLEQIIHSAYSFSTQSGFDKNTVLFHVLPMAYMAGILNTFFAVMVSGATIVEGPLFSPANALNFFETALENKVNTLSITPSIASLLIFITRSQDLIKKIRNKIIRVQSTSSYIPESTREDFIKKFGLTLLDCYGMTELGGPLTIQNQVDSANMLAFSTQVPGIHCITKGKNNNELWIKSPFSMLGYLDKGKLYTDQDKEGYFDTGDLAEIKEDRLKIIGRKKDIIIRGGINISPAKLESKLTLLSFVSEVAIVGVEHKFWGEIIVACIVPQDGEVIDKQKIFSFSKKIFLNHEQLDEVVFLEKLPRSFIGKILKNELKEILSNKITSH